MIYFSPQAIIHRHVEENLRISHVVIVSCSNVSVWDATLLADCAYYDECLSTDIGLILSKIELAPSLALIYSQCSLSVLALNTLSLLCSSLVV